MSYYRSDQGRENRREIRRWGGWGVGMWIILLLIAAVVSAGIWAVNVLVSEPKGRGDAVIIRNSAQNWTAAQARFESRYQEYEATLVRIENLVPQVEANPDSTTLTTQLNGLRSYCTSVVGEYNADARSFLSQDFRAADLPAQLDLSTCNN